MAELTLTQRFGTNATYNDTNKTITIKLSDLSDSPTGDITGSLGLNISSLTAANINSYTSKILYALLLLNYQKQPVDNTDETVLLYINQPRKGSAVVRNSISGISQFAFQMTVNMYALDNLGTVIDPDLMG